MRRKVIAMYDSHIYSKNYSKLKDTVANIVNDDDNTTDVQELADYIQELYDDGDLSSSQYDDLMSYVQDLL